MHMAQPFQTVFFPISKQNAPSLIKRGPFKESWNLKHCRKHLIQYRKSRVRALKFKKMQTKTLCPVATVAFTAKSEALA